LPEFETTTRALAAAADLPLAADREALVGEQLGAWLAAANELSRKMSAPEHWMVTPVCVFVHPDLPGGEQ
jgi:hypothetical protein